MGEPTFLGVPRCDLSDVESYAGADVVILGAPYEIAAVHDGAGRGPAMLRHPTAHRVAGSSALESLKVLDAGDVDLGRGVLSTLEDAVYAVASSGVIPVILGGDGCIVLPDIAGVTREVGYGRLSVVHFAAQAGIDDVASGCPYGRWEPLRELVEAGAVRPDRMVHLGVRQPSPTTVDWMAGRRMRWYGWPEIADRGLSACLDEAFAIAVDDSDGVFVSVDVNVTDPRPPGGLAAPDLLAAVRRCAYELPLLGLDVTGAGPPPDGHTARLGRRVVVEALSATARRRRDNPRRPPHPPLAPL